MPSPQVRHQTRGSYVSALAGDPLSLAAPGEPDPSLHPEIFYGPSVTKSLCHQSLASFSI